MNYYMLNIGDFTSDVGGLDFEYQGIFINLLNRYMKTEKPIKTDWVSLRFQGETQKKATALLNSFFEEVEDGWIYAPLADFLRTYQEKADRARVNGQKGGRPKKNKNPNETQSVSSGFSNETETKADRKLTNNQEPLTNNQLINNPLTLLQGEAPDGASVKPKRKWQGLMTDRPDDVPAADWDQWIQIRKLKKLPVTDLAIEKMREEAKSAGLTLDQAVRKCIESGWGGFKASYLEQKQNVLPKTDRLGTGNPDEYLPNSRLKRQECRVYKRGI